MRRCPTPGPAADWSSPGHVDEFELDVVRIPEDDYRIRHRVAGVDHAGPIPESATPASLVSIALRPDAARHHAAPFGSERYAGERAGAGGGRIWRLFVEKLLSQDVCVPAMLGELAQHVEVHPAQRERAAPVAVDQVVQFQG